MKRDKNKLAAIAIRPTGTLAVIALFIVACGGEPLRPELSTEELTGIREVAANGIAADYNAAIQTMLSRMEFEVFSSDGGDAATFDMLAIHGGGASGPFAAGFLRGWGAVDDPAQKRPEFDHVTGSSSGSLLAPYAFLGSEEAYERAFETALNPPFDFGDVGIRSVWPTRSAILDNSLLRNAVENEFDDEFLNAIRRAGADHRVLLISATDLALGFLRVFDLGQEALHDDAVSRIQDVIIASTAVPALFPPVEIDDRLYTDGGVASTLFYGVDVQFFEKLASLWYERHPDTQMPRIRAWAIVNSKLYPELTNVQPRYPEVAIRSINLMMAYDRLKALSVLALMFDEADEMDGVNAEFRFVAIPQQSVTPIDVQDISDKALIRDLVELGTRMGKDPASWQTEPPGIMRLAE